MECSPRPMIISSLLLPPLDLVILERIAYIATDTVHQPRDYGHHLGTPYMQASRSHGTPVLSLQAEADYCTVGARVVRRPFSSSWGPNSTSLRRSRLIYISNGRNGDFIPANPNFTSARAA